MFSKGGFYSFVVESNALVHRETGLIGGRVVAEWLARREVPSTIKVLDLACGGMPITIADIMRQFGDVSFEYTGIDINPDQVRQTRDNFEFPHNVSVCTVVEGNAWDLGALQLNGPYDIIFSGMNFHHGTPEELYYVGKQIHTLLSEDGVFLSHDAYRPNGLPYIRRPNCNSDDCSISYRQVDEKVIAAIDVPDFGITDHYPHAPADEWRVEFFECFRSYLRQKGGEEDDITTCLDHVYERDYPVSAGEMTRILDAAGFHAEIHDFSEFNHPLGKYFAIVAAKKG